MTSELLFSRRTFAGARFAERSTGISNAGDQCSVSAEDLKFIFVGGISNTFLYIEN